MAEPAKAKVADLFPAPKGPVVTRLMVKEGGIEIGGSTRTSLSAMPGGLVPAVRMELAESLGGVWVRYLEHGQLRAELVPFAHIRQMSVAE